MKKRPGRMHLAEKYRVDDGRGFRLRRIDPRETSGIEEDEFDGLLERGIERLADLGYDVTKLQPVPQRWQP